MHTGRGIINHEVNYARKRIANCEQPRNMRIFYYHSQRGLISHTDKKVKHHCVIMIFDTVDVDMCDMTMIKIFSNLKCGEG